MYILTTDQKVTGLNPVGVTRKSTTYAITSLSGFFI